MIGAAALTILPLLFRASGLQPWLSILLELCVQQNLHQIYMFYLKSHLLSNLLKYTKNSLKNITMTLKLTTFQDDCIRITGISTTHQWSSPYLLQNLTQLTTLWFGGNQLIPPWIAKLSQLYILSFSRNKLSGRIPQSLSRLTNLRTLNLYQNYFDGMVDFAMFDDIKNLAELALGKNMLSVHTKRANVTNSTIQKFEILGLTPCNLWEFPDSLRYQDKLRLLDLSGNNINGPHAHVGLERKHAKDYTN